MDLDNKRIIEELNTSRRDFLKLLGKGAAVGSKLNLPAKDIVKSVATSNADNDFVDNVLYKALYRKILSHKDRFNQILNPQAIGTNKKIDDKTVGKLADAAYAVIADDKEMMKRFMSSLKRYHEDNPDLLKNKDILDEWDGAYGEFHFLDPYQMFVKALTSMGKTNSDFFDPHEMQKLADKMLNSFGYVDPEVAEYNKKERELEDKERKYPKDYLERDYAEGPHMNSYKNADNRRIIEELADQSRREFLRRLGGGVASAVSFPWTKLLSSPALAKTVTAPFKIGGGSILNPQALYKYYLENFLEKAIDSGITPVGKMMAGGGEDEIPEGAFRWVAKNFVDNYVADLKHNEDWARYTLAPTVYETVENIGRDDFLEYHWDKDAFPDWAKDLLRKGMEHDEAELEREGSGTLSAEDQQRYNELMSAKWFDPEDADNFDYLEEEVDDLLSKWMGLTGRSDSDATDDPVFDQVFDHISNLIHHEGYSLDQIYKMDFRKQFLPGVADMIRSNAANLEAEREELEPGDEDYDDRDYLERDYAEGPHMNSYKPEMSFKEFFNESGSDRPSRFIKPSKAKSARAGLYHGLKGKDEYIRQRHKQEVSAKQLARELGVKDSSLLSKAKKLGLKFAGKPGMPRQHILDDELIIQRHDANKSAREIGRELGVSHKVITDRGKELGLNWANKPGMPGYIGSGEGHRDWIDIDPEEVRQRHKDGKNMTQIAKELGVSRGVIKRIANDLKLHFPLGTGRWPKNTGQGKQKISSISQRTRNITGPGNVGADHQTFYGSPKTVQTNRPGPRRGQGH